MKYITKQTVTVYKTSLGIGKRCNISGGEKVRVIDSRWGYDQIDSPVNGWVKHSLLERDDFVYPPPPDVIPDGTNIWHTIRGDQKRWGYKPAGANYKNTGSFDIGWGLDSMKIVKPRSIVLTHAIMDSILILNHRNQDAVDWLVSQKGNDKQLTVDEDGRYKCPVPCWSGNNIVNVLEIIGNFARVEAVDIHKPIPADLPDYLLHTWYAFTKDGHYYMPFAGVGGVKYPLLSDRPFFFVQMKGLYK